jgi:cytochrome c55X
MVWRRALFGLLICASVSAQPPSEARQQQLLNLLKHDCGSCHGLPPKGGLGPALMPEALADKSDRQLIDTIQNGRPGSAMPPWQPFLSEAETGWLVQQLRSGRFWQ